MVSPQKVLFGILFSYVSLSGAWLEENRGQFSREVAFVTSNVGVETAVTDRGILFRSSRAAFGLRFEGASSVKCTPDSPISSEANYLNGALTLTHVHQYSSVICPGLYTGIDWVIRAGSGSLEHDWRLAAGANAGAISMRLDESAAAEVLPNGDLRLSSGEMKIIWKVPVAYQYVSGERLTVTVQYAVAGHRITLVAGRHRDDLPWVIDPLIDFTYLIAGDADSYASQVALDGTGNIYVAGYTNATNFAVTSGAAYQKPANSSSNAFIRKLSPDGSKVIYSTYLGSVAASTGRPIAMRVDSAGDVYLALVPGGVLPGSGMPISAGGEVGLYKLAPGGDHLLYGTQLLPNIASAGPVGLTIDSSGDAYVALFLASGSISVAKVDPTGARQLLSFQVPVSNYSGGLADIALGPDGSIYLAGTSSSGGLVTTPGSFQPTPANPGGSRGFVVRMKPDGSAPIYSTYVSGQYVDTLTSLYVDQTGAAYLGGQTNSLGVASGLSGTSLGLSQPLSTGGYVLKLDPAGSKAVFTALVPTNLVNALTLDGAGNIYAAGANASGFTLSKIDSSGSKLLYHSTIATPGPGTATGFGLTVDSAGAAYLAGSVASVQAPDLVQSSRVLPNALLLKMDAAPDQTDLSMSVSPSVPFVPGFGAPLTFTIQNNGTADAKAVVFSATLDVGVSASCRVSGSGVCGTDTDHPRATFNSIPAGGSVTVELVVNTPSSPQEPAVANATVSTLTSDVSQDNNYSNGSDALNVISFMVGASGVSGLTCTITNATFSLCSPGEPIYAVTGSPVTITWPSPQVSSLNGLAWSFTNWNDGSTDNPRTIVAGSGPQLLLASFSLAPAPYVKPTGVTNSGSYSADGVAPGELVTLFGFNFGSNGSAVVQNGKFPTAIGATSITFDGHPAPLIYASGTQVNAIVPYEIAGQSSTTITVQGGGKSSTVTVPVVQAVPALFTANGSGTDEAAALNADQSVNSPANPANPGDVIVLYGSGAGLVNAPPVDGTITVPPFSAPNLAVTVAIGGAPAQVLYSGDAPGLVSGVIQINAVIPNGITYSHHVPVKWSAGSFSSPDGVTIAVNDKVTAPGTLQGSADDLSKASITISPTHIPADSSSTKVTVVGTGFTSGMVVNWNGIPIPTTFLDSMRVQAVVPGALLEPAGLGWVSVWDSGHATQITQSTPVIVYVPLLNHDLVYDAVRSRIYIAVAATQKPQGSSIAVLNPQTQRLERVLPLAAEPTKLAISDDDRYLYVAAGNFVQRIDLTTWTNDLSINVGANPSGVGSTASSIKVLPGMNTGLMVLANGTISVYDGAQVRTNVIKSFNGPSFLVGGPDAGTMYGSDTAGDLFALAVTTSGVSVAGEWNGLLGADGDPVYANGLIYDGWGGIVDPTIPAVVGTFDNQGLVVPLTDLGLALILGGAPPPGYSVTTGPPQLSLNSITGGARYWSLAIPAQTYQNHGPLLRWGQNGIALREPGAYATDPSSGVDLFQVNLSVTNPAK
jgi:uncharacterized protein (TIGR03437 family)